jgi:hypothetical protein
MKAPNAGLWWKAAAVWLAMAVIAMVNGAVREAAFLPLLGTGAARVLSVLTLLTFISALTWAYLKWVGAALPNSFLWQIGAAWLLLTVLFETAPASSSWA